MEKVQEQIDNLVKLQEIDAEIYRLNEEKALKPVEKEELTEEFEQKKALLKTKEDELKAMQLKRKDRELDLETKEKEVKKYQTQLLQIKTNKEYMSLQKQIAGLKADNSVLEDEILELLEKVDKVRQAVSQDKENLVAEENRWQEETKKIDREIGQIEERIAFLGRQRTELCANVEKTLLAKYERILKAKSGLAFVPVVGETCGGCHKVVPPQVINETRMKDKMITCEFCARLLYWPQ